VNADSRPRLKWPYVLGIVAGLLAGLVLFVFLRTRNIEERTREWVVRELQQRFHSEVELEQLHVNLLPRIGVDGEGLSVRYHNRRDLPPMFHVQKFSFNLGVLGILRAPRHIAGIYVENMTITVPPRGEKKEPKPENQPIPSVIVDEIVCNNTDLVIVPKKEGKEPLGFDIHDLVLKSVGVDKPFDFHGNLTNAKPEGEIATIGTFGPWDADEPGDTPVTGSYKFSDADLGPFPGIGGTLSSTGDYHGQLNEIEVEGKTDTPNFSLDPVGRPVPLHTDFSATVNGTDGDTYLHPVRATLGKSLIIAEGSVVRVPEKHGHIIKLDVSAPDARIQDILSLAVNSDQPLMAGPAKIKAKLLLPPGKQKVLEKMILDGQVGVEDAQWSSPEIRDKLESLSRRAEGQPENQAAGSSVSDLRGDFRLQRGIIRFRKLNFAVPGAQVILVGNYDIGESKIDFQGHLRLQAKLSQTVTGKKSFFLKAVDPFFSKEGAGTVLPITITGTRNAPTLGVSVFHKTIKKELGSGGNDRKDSNQSKNPKPNTKR
jgi:hypothetical protein